MSFLSHDYDVEVGWPGVLVISLYRAALGPHMVYFRYHPTCLS